MAAEKGDWQTVTNRFEEMVNTSSSDSHLHGSWWPPVVETYGVMEQFAIGDEKYPIAFGSRHHPVNTGREYLFWRH